MDFHGINTVGKIWLERVSFKPAFGLPLDLTNPNVGRVIFALDNSTLSIGTSGGWIDIASATQGGITNPSVPVGGVILFYSDTVLPGYTLYTDDPTITDDLVYITKGSGALDEPGRAAKMSGSWIQPPHSHAQQGFQLLIQHMPSHTHPPQAGFGNFMSSTGSSHGRGGDAYGVFSNTGSTGGNEAHTHPNSIANGTVSGWRPKGRNFTLQEKV
jgi:hypothetical protein